MEKEDAKKILLEEGRYTYSVEKAEEIAKAFGVELDKKLIRTTRGYRENIVDESLPRVSISSLSESICKMLGKKPDEKTFTHACRMNGEGSYRDLKSKAYAMNL